MTDIRTKSCTKCKIVKNHAEFGKRASHKSGLQSHCKSCNIIIVREWDKANPKARNAIRSKWRENNRDRARDYRKNNRGLQNATTVKRRAQKLNATPAWAEIEQIKQFYRDCPNGYHVDHIIPLQGDNVSGLHVLSNLCYLPIVSNCSKGNRVVTDEQLWDLHYHIKERLCP